MCKKCEKPVINVSKTLCINTTIPTPTHSEYKMYSLIHSFFLYIFTVFPQPNFILLYLLKCTLSTVSTVPTITTKYIYLRRINA